MHDWVQVMVRRSCPNAVVVSLEHVHAPHLWRRYRSYRDEDVAPRTGTVLFMLHTPVHCQRSLCTTCTGGNVPCAVCHAPTVPHTHTLWRTLTLGGSPYAARCVCEARHTVTEVFCVCACEADSNPSHILQ